MRFTSRALWGLSLALFLASALVGVLISYNPAEAWWRFSAVGIGVALCVALTRLPEKHLAFGRLLEPLSILFCWLPLVMLIYFVLTNDWTARLGKLPQFDALLAVLAAWQPKLPGIRLDSNALGGLLAAFLPLQFGAVSQIEKKAWLKVLLIGVSLAGLVLSESRGAWLALAIVAAMAMLWQVAGRIAREKQFALTFGIVLLVVVLGIAALFMPQGQRLLALRDDRVQVWQNSLALASDYPFTGIGLGGFDMAYSSYVLLLHVSHTIHAHNLYLDIWLEQGLLGLIAFGALVAAALGSIKNSATSLKLFGLAALCVILLHGWVDDPFYGYGAKTIPFLFVPFGVLARQPGANRKTSAAPMVWAIGIVLVAIVALTIFVPALRAAWTANLGALNQTRTELSVYHWPQVPIQDDLRRSDKIDLTPAIALYQTALTIDAANATANRRLGQIELAREHYASAQNYLEAALRAAPNQRATRQLLGEVYALNGDDERAGALWRTIDMSNDQLAIRAWWYTQIGEPDKAAQLRQVIGRSD